MIRTTYICDSCHKEEVATQARAKRWLGLSQMWQTKMDWEQTEFVFCSLDCLVKSQTRGTQYLASKEI